MRHPAQRKGLTSKASKVFVFSILLTALTSCATIEEEIAKLGGNETAGAIFGGIIGYKIGDIFGEGSRYEKEIKYLSTLGGTYFGKKFGEILDERDLARMTLSTQQTMTSGKESSWENPENKTSGKARVVATETKPEPIKVKVLKSKVQQVPPLDIIGSTYIAKGSNVRGGPSTDYVVVGSLAPEKAVNVVGKVKTKNWMMISEGGVGSGFVRDDLLVEAPATEPDETASTASAEDIAEEEVASERVCRSIENTVSLPDGTTEQETITACQGPNGWEVQPVVS